MKASTTWMQKTKTIDFFLGTQLFRFQSCFIKTCSFIFKGVRTFSLNCTSALSLKLYSVLKSVSFISYLQDEFSPNFATVSFGFFLTIYFLKAHVPSCQVTGKACQVHAKSQTLNFEFGVPNKS